jgi:hypothetical protein
MASSLRVNAIVPSSGNNVAIGTAGGTISLVTNVSGISTFATVRATSIVGVSTIGVTTAYVGSINDGPISGARNRIINGDMRIDQRNGGASVIINAGTTTYTVDRMIVLFLGATSTAQRVSVSGPFSNALRLNGAAGVTNAYIVQRIESLNSRDLADSNATVTLSWYAASSTKTSMEYAASYATVNDNFAASTSIASGTVSITSTLTRYSATFQIPAGATTGLAIELRVSSFTSGTFDVTGVQLEAGTVATPFERRSFGQELALCQRYYYRNTAANISAAWGSMYSTSAGRVWSPLPVTMRATAPILTIENNTYDRIGTGAATGTAANGASSSFAVTWDGTSVSPTGIFGQPFCYTGSFNVSAEI